MLLTEMIVVLSQNNTEFINAIHGENVIILNVITGGTYTSKVM
jgi:hypothetical protein